MGVDEITTDTPTLQIDRVPALQKTCRRRDVDWLLQHQPAYGRVSYSVRSTRSPNRTFRRFVVGHIQHRPKRNTSCLMPHQSSSSSSSVSHLLLPTLKWVNNDFSHVLSFLLNLYCDFLASRPWSVDENVVLISPLAPPAVGNSPFTISAIPLPAWLHISAAARYCSGPLCHVSPAYLLKQ